MRWNRAIFRKAIWIHQELNSGLPDHEQTLLITRRPPEPCRPAYRGEMTNLTIYWIRCAILLNTSPIEIGPILNTNISTFTIKLLHKAEMSLQNRPTAYKHSSARGKLNTCLINSSFLKSSPKRKVGTAKRPRNRFFSRHRKNIFIFRFGTKMFEQINFFHADMF